MNDYDVIVIGGGPAGLVAAARAGERGAKVLLLEKMKAAGRKLLITGKGRCNVTNNLPIREFIKHTYPKGAFLKKAFSSFYYQDIIDLLERFHVPCILEEGYRYFPFSNISKDVLDALTKWCKENNVEIKCNSRVEDFLVENCTIRGVKVNGIKYPSKNVIVATGGKSYPATGSTGDGYNLAQKYNHKIETPFPALVPFETEGKLAQNLQGLNLRKVKAVMWVNGKKVGEALDDILFTHFGISGPAILTLSRFAVSELDKGEQVELTVDLKPEIDEKALDKKLIEDLNAHGKKKLSNIMKYWLPASMINAFFEHLTIDSEKECNQLSGKERKAIKNFIKNLRFKVKRHRGYKEAIITSGGISLDDISSKSMESKRIKGLYFAGEVIDLDAKTGGFNLQIAYSTGWLAGNSCEF